MLFDAAGPQARVLVVRLDNIGDMVMMTPALRSIRAAGPEAHVTLLASRAGAQVAPMVPWIDQTLVHRAMWQELTAAPPDPDAELAFTASLRRGNYDAALVFTSFSQSAYPPAYACYLAGIPIRAGLTRTFGGRTLSHPFVPPSDTGHQADRNLFLTTSLGVPPLGTGLELSIPPGAHREAHRLLLEVGVDPDRPYILLSPAASCAARTYDPTRFGQVAQVLARESGLPLVITGRTQDAVLLGPCLDVLGRAEGASVVGRTSVPVLASLIDGAALLVGSHSGSMHLADAVGCPMVILFSGTDLPSQWRPRSAPAKLLGRFTACTPCGSFRCPSAMECLDISPREVVESCLPMLEAHARYAPQVPA
jgi:ADP-heptose:LPS heptosyltransferase